MPFARKTNVPTVRVLPNAHHVFIGRTSELLFFTQNILKPEEPVYNILSLWGQGGVGKSTLLARFLRETQMADFKDYCVTALVDERQFTPLRMMEQFAAQFHLVGTFEKLLRRYKETLTPLPVGQVSLQDTLMNKASDVAGAMVEGLPLAGPILREGTKATTEHLLEKYRVSQKRKDVQLFTDVIENLTQAFVAELNALVENKVTLHARRAKRERRVLLFFDTFEQLAVEAVPWLLDHFLNATINSNVVLILAGRYPLERSTVDGPKRWLPFYENGTLHSLLLKNFTKEETSAYLTERGVKSTDRQEAIWHLSHGLPLYLGLLTSNVEGEVDPTKDVVDNFLYHIPEHEQVKRKLVLDAALFSTPFNQDDLDAFAYLSDQERPGLYRWLIEQSFVQSTSQEGRYRYHEVTQDLFSRHLYQHSPKDYYATRKALSHYYMRLFKATQPQRSKNGYPSSKQLEVIQAACYQLFFLPDEVSHLKAAELLMDTVAHITMSPQQSRQIIHMLQGLSQAQVSDGIPLPAQYVVKPLLSYIEVELVRWGQEMLKAANDLLLIVCHSSSCSQELLASVYRSRGWAHYELAQYQRAKEDFDRALDFNPQLSDAYSGRGWAYLRLYEYERAIEDFNHTIALNPSLGSAINGRGNIYRKLKEFERALEEYHLLVKVVPKYEVSYLHRGRTYLWLKDLQRAEADMICSREVNPESVMCHWAVEWLRMCQDKPDPSIAERLEKFAAIEPEECVAYICRGVAKWFQQRFAEALTELQHAVLLQQEAVKYLHADALFWIAMSYASLGYDKKALAALQQALALELPPVLLSPLRWLELEKRDCYPEYAVLFLS